MTINQPKEWLYAEKIGVLGVLKLPKSGAPEEAANHSDNIKDKQNYHQPD